jgi:hypothetical protein
VKRCNKDGCSKQVVQGGVCVHEATSKPNASPKRN